VLRVSLASRVLSDLQVLLALKVFRESLVLQDLQELRA
jgi:hypothetical protein